MIPLRRPNLAPLVRRAVEAAPWTPASIANLVAWWDFSDATKLFTDAGTTPVANNDDAIYQANDKSGNDHHLVQADSDKRPLWKTNQQNGLATAKGDGSNDFLAKASGFWSVGTSNWSLFLVVKIGSSTRQSLHIVRPSQGQIYTYENISSKQRLNAKSDASEEVAGGAWDIAAPTTAYYLSSTIRNGTTFSRYINGGSANNQTATIGQSTTDRIYLFCQSGTAAFHDGYIAEVLLYSAALSAGDFALLKTYLNTKWAVY